MSIGNALLLKVGGGLTAAGTVTGVGIVYKNEIAKLFSQIVNGDDNHLLLVGSKNNETGDIVDEELYKNIGESDKKEKNYKCKVEQKFYECDIIQKIEDNSNKKWIDTKNIFANETVNNSLTKTDLKTEHTLFLLKIVLLGDDIKDPSTIKMISVVEKNQKVEDTKKFAEIVPIFVKKNSQILNKLNYFLVKIKDFAIENTNDEYQIAANESYKCGFITDEEKTIDSSKLKECSIYKFSSTEQTDASETKQYNDLTFVEKEEQIAANSKIKKYGYYIVKFTEGVDESKFLNKNLIYLKINVSNSEKIVNFSPFIPAFLSPKADDKKLLLLAN